MKTKSFSRPNRKRDVLQGTLIFWPLFLFLSDDLFSKGFA